jgi:ABC-type microcin C transport system permease subunit YejE
MCPTSCIIAGAFIISSIFVCLRVDKQTLKDPLFNLLSEENKKRYINIANERKDIYLKGFGIGFIVSLIALLFINNNKMFKVTKLVNICFVLATSYTINYFFYILHPKSDYMVLHLKNTEEKHAWLDIYKTMQFNYHLGFALGLIGMIFIGNSFC